MLTFTFYSCPSDQLSSAPLLTCLCARPVELKLEGLNPCAQGHSVSFRIVELILNWFRLSVLMFTSVCRCAWLALLMCPHTGLLCLLPPKCLLVKCCGLCC